MNIEELFTLSGTGLVIGALLSWLACIYGSEGSGQCGSDSAQFTPAAFIRRQSTSSFQSCRSASCFNWPRLGTSGSVALVHVADEYGLVSLLSNRHFL